MRAHEIITESIAPKKLVSRPIKKTRLTVAEFRDSYMERHGVGVRQLLHGDCEEFADEFIATFGGTMYVTPEDERFGNYYHFFMQLSDRFYDGASPEGVADWRELPSIKEYFLR